MPSPSNVLTREIAFIADSSKASFPLPLRILYDNISPVGTKSISISVFKFWLTPLGLFQLSTTCFLMIEENFSISPKEILLM